MGISINGQGCKSLAVCLFEVEKEDIAASPDGTEARVKDVEDSPGASSPILSSKRGPVTGVSPEDVFSAKRPRYSVFIYTYLYMHKCLLC